MIIHYIQIHSDYEVYECVHVCIMAIFCREIAKSMDFLRRNPYKLTSYLYNINDFLVLLRTQLNFYTIGRQPAGKEKIIVKRVQDCAKNGTGI